MQLSAVCQSTAGSSKGVWRSVFAPVRLTGARRAGGVPAARRPVKVQAKKKSGQKKQAGGFMKTTKKPNLDDGWTYAGNLGEFADKPTKTVSLTTGKTVVVYKAGDEVFCSDVNGTAYEFPLVDANVIEGPSGPAIECPFDGTTYDLATGAVIEWCPRNNPLRSFLGMVKSKVEPQDLGVHEAIASADGGVYIRLKNA
ncbi:hypothetical protein BSKO_04790 [Bryopsis sp. KO-2023]|nr:hypothetical protein BSKO_04790 [Bryopsis sp. KO-2023]